MQYKVNDRVYAWSDFFNSVTAVGHIESINANSGSISIFDMRDHEVRLLAEDEELFTIGTGPAMDVEPEKCTTESRLNTLNPKALELTTQIVVEEFRLLANDMVENPCNWFSEESLVIPKDLQDHPETHRWVKEIVSEAIQDSIIVFIKNINQTKGK